VGGSPADGAVPVGEGAGRAVGSDGRHGDDRVGALDCDVLTAHGTDLRLVTDTAEPGSEDASRFDLIRTLGTVSVTPA